jgi:hypothetical protein
VSNVVAAFTFADNTSMPSTRATVTAFVVSQQWLHAAACNPIAYVHQLEIQSVLSPFFISHTESNLDVTFKSVALTGSYGKNVGFQLLKNGSEFTEGVCPQSSDGQVPGAIGFLPSVSCALPALDVGTYKLALSGDRSCGSRSYWSTDVEVEIIEPAHTSSVVPSQGAATATSNITVTGTNIGGPHVSCEFTFEAGHGAKLDGSGNPMGCSMKKADYPAQHFTADSVSCVAPAWPGPVQQCGMHGCHDVDGAVCSRKVRVAISNDAKVHSPEPLYFNYVDSAEVVV